jgi:hypothetical protein
MSAALFSAIEEDSAHQFCVEVSFVQLYNEQAGPAGPLRTHVLVRTPVTDPSSH